jgi:hypothetical protein
MEGDRLRSLVEGPLTSEAPPSHFRFAPARHLPIVLRQAQDRWGG